MLVLLAVVCAGCDKGGITHVEMRVVNGFLTPAQPLEVAPDVHVSRNEFVAWDGGFRGRQRLEITGNATLILVPGYPAFWMRAYETIVYVGRRKGTATAIEIKRSGWQYRRVDVTDGSTRLDDAALRDRLAKASWNPTGDWRCVTLRNLLRAWIFATNATRSYRRGANGTTDQLILDPAGVFGTTGDAASPPPPPEWNTLIYALRELCPAYNRRPQATPQPES